ncbi:MAG TPA: N(4)-(beta-N-acetylglucosaminyl)-L-asparaginase, partial [Candidatus Acidoferrales bacterium]|nr:N(4)-(beta-N-acetylglucosaminyl)-L-asparaginase [Candidatus Acidoferrales bacterium]
MNNWTRRKFFLTSLAGGVAAGARNLFGGQAPATQAAPKGTRPLIISSANGLQALTLGMGMLKRGLDTLEAVVSTVNVVEDDPKDNSVGYGGLPNEDGDVELDASVMHGPTRRAGAVGSIRHIKNPSKVAKLVMERTDHLMLVGAGALRFAEAHGFERINLLTDDSRRRWLAWKETMSDMDSWGPGLTDPSWKDKMAGLLPSDWSEEQKVAELAYMREIILHPPTGTINCCAVNEKGEISGTTTTSGLAWKLAGRVGDSPIIGAGLFVDNEVGAAGSTGRGEENIKICGAHTIVEMMRKGMSPTDACLEACKRVAWSYNNEKTRLRKFNINFYALNKDGIHGGAVLWGTPSRTGRRPSYAVHDGVEAKLVPLAPLFETAAT